MKIRIAHLYPQELNMYGDRGNILTLYRRCQWRGIDVSIDLIHPKMGLKPEVYDLFFMGGGQDAQQLKVAHDLQALKLETLQEAAQLGAVFLGICGGYQLFGHDYQPHEGNRLIGLNILDISTTAGPTRFIGNIVLQRPNGEMIVGFENHSGLTRLGLGVQPLGKVILGYGNNGQDKQEGAVSGNIYGTYLHGSLLPKNPSFADELIQKALIYRYQEEVVLTPLEDRLECQAHQRALALKS